MLVKLFNKYISCTIKIETDNVGPSNNNYTIMLLELKCDTLIPIQNQQVKLN